MRPREQGIVVRLFCRTSVLALVLVAFGLGGAVAAPPAREVRQLTTTLPTLNTGQTAWVATLWHGASVNATEFKMTASGPTGITISYPENTGSYSSLYKESTLRAEDTDYASLKIAVGSSVAAGNKKIKLTVTYKLPAPGKAKKEAEAEKDAEKEAVKERETTEEKETGKEKEKETNKEKVPGQEKEKETGKEKEKETGKEKGKETAKAKVAGKGGEKSVTRHLQVTLPVS